MDKRDPKRFYCENCPHNYSTKADLKKHVQRSCLSNNPEFVCPEGKCNWSFFSKRGVREHYYKEHTDLHAYTFSKCNQGFHHHTQYNPHIKMCQGKEEGDCE